METSIDKIMCAHSIQRFTSFAFTDMVNTILDGFKEDGQYRVVNIQYQIIPSEVGNEPKQYVALFSLRTLSSEK